MPISKPPIRTITLGLPNPHPLNIVHIAQAAQVLQKASQRALSAGYELQTTRIATRPLFDDLANWSPDQIKSYVKQMQTMLENTGIMFCSLGPAQAANPAFQLAFIDLIPDLLASASSINLTVQLADREHGLRQEAAAPTARTILRLANETTGGDGNFRFAMLAMVEPGGPFFPAAYHTGPASLSVGLQGASIIHQETYEQPSLAHLTEHLRSTIEETARPVVELVEGLAERI